MKIRSILVFLWAVLLCGMSSCKKEDIADSHFIYFSPTEPYTRIGAIKCEIDQIAGEIRNVEPVPGNVDITAMPVYFATNHEHKGVYVNGVAQVSGVTLNDFSSPVVYEVHSDAGVHEYIVTLTKDETCMTQTAVRLKGNDLLVKRIDQESETWLAQGVRQSVVDFTTTDNRKVRFCMVEADMRSSSLTLRTCLPNDEASWGQQTLLDMTAAMETNGNKVLCAINGDTFNDFGEPDGLVLRDNEILNVMDSRLYFGIRNDGRVSIGDNADFFAVESKLTNAVGASKLIVNKGGLVSDLIPDETFKSRTAAGMDSHDLKTLYFVAVQGMNASSGLTLGELADCLLSMGVGYAATLSDQESTSFVSYVDGNLQAVNKSDLARIANGIALIRK